MLVLCNLWSAIQILGMAVYSFAKWGTFMCKVISISKICYFSLEYAQHIICIPPNNLYIEGASKSFLDWFYSLVVK